MKISRLKHPLSDLLSGTGKRYSAWLIIFGVILFGGYLLKNRLGLWGVVGVGVAGILIGTGACFLRNWMTSAKTNNVRAGKNLPQIASAWDYRPRDLSLQSPTSTPDVSEETTDVSGLSHSAVNESTDIWLNFASQESDS